MNTHPCCHATSCKPDQTSPIASRFGRGIRIAGWIVPGAALILLPKCPMCIAMYLGLFTGIGISLTTASSIRAALLTLCSAMLLGLALKSAGRLISRKRNP
jgi:hypothetical protein